MWQCKGTEEVNPVSSLILKINNGMGFDVLDYDTSFPFITTEDTLDSYLAKYNEDYWLIDKDLEPRLGDTLIFSYEGHKKGKLLGEAGVNAGTIINNDMQIPFMRGSKSPLKGIVKLQDILIEGYQLEYVVRARHFDNFSEITSGKQLVALLLK